MHIVIWKRQAKRTSSRLVLMGSNSNLYIDHLGGVGKSQEPSGRVWHSTAAENDVVLITQNLKKGPVSHLVPWSFSQVQPFDFFACTEEQSGADRFFESKLF